MLFLKKYPHIYKIKAKDGSVISFNPNKIQKKVLEKIESDLKEKGKSRIIIVKGRQGGITTLFQLLGLSYAMSEKAFNCYTMAHDSTTATDIFEQKIKFAFDNLPTKLKSLYTTKRDNTRQLMFDNEMQKSTITVGTSARGTTQNFLHISEAGKMSERRQSWDEMISGTLQASKQARIIAIESTADGGLGTFYEMVQKSLRNESEFDVIFLSWLDTEEYKETLPESEEWKEKYSILAKTYNLYSNPVSEFGISQEQWYWYYLTAQELKEEVKVQYPFTLEEAFVSRAKTKFDINIVKNLKTQAPLQILDGVKIYRLPEQNQIYSLGIDPSSGLGKDWTCLTLRGFYPDENGKHKLYAQMKAKLGERETARVSVNLANWFNQTGKVLIVPEVNGLGRAVVNEIINIYDNDLIFKRFINDPTKQRDTLIPDFGWQTTGNNRDLIINNFAYSFADNKLEILNEEEKDEMKTFIYVQDDKDVNKGRYEAQEGANDDLLFSDMICFAGFDYIRKYL